MARASQMGVITFILRNHSGIKLFSGKWASTGKVKREQTLCFLRLTTRREIANALNMILKNSCTVAGAPVTGPGDLTCLTVTESRTAPSRGGQNSDRGIRKVCSV